VAAGAQREKEAGAYSLKGGEVSLQIANQRAPGPKYVEASIISFCFILVYFTTYSTMYFILLRNLSYCVFYFISFHFTVFYHVFYFIFTTYVHDVFSLEYTL